jgi:hypothetical protein
MILWWRYIFRTKKRLKQCDVIYGLPLTCLAAPGTPTEGKMSPGKSFEGVNSTLWPSNVEKRESPPKPKKETGSKDRIKFSFFIEWKRLINLLSTNWFLTDLPTRVQLLFCDETRSQCFNIVFLKGQNLETTIFSIKIVKK